MKKIEMIAAFEREIGLLDDVLLKPKTTDSEYWISSAIQEFTKTRYSGNNYKLTSFEQNQKRIDDLRMLVTDKFYSFTNPQSLPYKVDLPSDYLVALGEQAVISSFDKCWPSINGEPVGYATDVLETTVEEIDRDRQNALSEYRLHANRARPLRLFQGNQILLYTDSKYFIDGYTLTYLRRPSNFTLGANVFAEYTELPEHTHLEIIKIAARKYIEQQGDTNRYQTYSNEINSME